MSLFKDGAGREWELKLTVGALRAVRERTRIEIGKLIASEQGVADLLFGDPDVFAQVLWVLIEKQVQAKGIGEADLADSLDGEANERAVFAMMGAISDFFPRSAVGRAVKRRLPEMMARMDERLVSETDKAMDQAIARLSTPSATAGGSPASAASTPAP